MLITGWMIPLCYIKNVVFKKFFNTDLSDRTVVHFVSVHFKFMSDSDDDSVSGWCSYTVSFFHDRALSSVFRLNEERTAFKAEPGEQEISKTDF